MNINHLKHKVHDTYKNDDKITTNFEPTKDIDVINKGYLNENIIKIHGQIAVIAKAYYEFKIQYKK